MGHEPQLILKAAAGIVRSTSLRLWGLRHICAPVGTAIPPRPNASPYYGGCAAQQAADTTGISGGPMWATGWWVGWLQLSRGLDVTALVTESAIDSLEIQAPFGVVCLIHSLRRRYFPHLRRDSPRPGRICAGNGLTLATSGRLPSWSHLRRDSPHPCHIHSLRHRDAHGRLPGLLLNTR